MSKRINRNNTKKIPYQSFPRLVENNCSKKFEQKNCFGENVRDDHIKNFYRPFSEETPPHSFSTLHSGSDTDSITLDLNKLSGLSSSSSLSWSDEYESETTKIVQEELKRMDRVLRGIDPIPPHYDKEECELWMNTFPNISILDDHITPVNSVTNILEKLDEEDDQMVFSIKGRSNLTNSSTLGISGIKNKQTVIEAPTNSKNNLNSILHRKSADTRKKRIDISSNRKRSIFSISQKPKSLDTDKYLKISSIKNYEREFSSKSLVLNRQIAKEYPDASTEYTSLPFIRIEDVNTKKNGVSINNPHFYHKKKINNLVLPPIASSVQYRSISATPRPSNNNSFSAFLMKFSSELEPKINESFSGFLKNSVSNR